MPGWGPIGRFAIGELPASGVAPQAPFGGIFLEPAKPLRRSVAVVTSLNVLLYSTPFQQNWPPVRRINPSVPSATRPINLNLVANEGPFAKLDWNVSFHRRPSAPQAAPYNLNLIASLGPFTQSMPLPARVVTNIPSLPAPNVVVLDFQSRPFAQLEWKGSRSSKLPSLNATLGFNLSLYYPPDTHDLVFMGDQFRKKKRKDLIDEELHRKERLRRDIEQAVYGPEVVYSPPSAEKPDAKAAQPKVEELARTIMAAREAQAKAQRAAIEQDDEDMIEMILRDL